MAKFAVVLVGKVDVTHRIEVDAPNHIIAKNNAIAAAPDPVKWTIMPDGVLSSVKAESCEEINEDDLIEAKANTDNYAIEFKFNTVLWFKQASDEDILALAKLASPTLESLWGGGREADQVAEHFRDGPTKLLFDYLATKPRMGRDTVGFECYINGEQAMTWLRKYRPALAAKLEAEVEAEE